MKTRLLFYFIFFITLVIILMGSFTSSTSGSTSAHNPSSPIEIPFPEDYKSYARVDSVPEVQFPEGYRRWTHVKSGVTIPSGYHHIYANAIAMEGYRTGKFPNGSIIAVDFLEMIDNESKIDEGERRYIDVMVKDTVLYSTTGGWGFEEFDGNSKSIRKITQANAHAACYTCHTKRLANDFVFSEYRE
jgi:hypothetical protein